MTRRFDSLRLAVPFAQRLLLMAALWWAIAEGRPRAWLFGVPVIALAAGASLVLQSGRTWRLRPFGALRFAGHFLSRSLLGGIDVARRALHPRMPLAPAFVHYPLRLQDPSARILVVATFSLLPGTLSAELERDAVCVHVLDTALPVRRNLRELEACVADLLGVPLREVEAP